MHKITLKKIPFSQDADNRLRALKGRIGITPNLICRIGFCLSIEESGLPREMEKIENIEREINRYTLLGEYDLTISSLLQAWLVKHKIDVENDNEMNHWFLAHMVRGIDLFNSRVKNISDIGKLVAKY